MFAKLLKYEWRSNAATCSVLSLCALGVSVLGGIGLRYLVAQGPLELETSAIMGIMMMLMAVIFSLAAYAIAVFVIQLVRFYKSRFTDQGYLTFTLPVSVHQIFLSSALNMLIWSVLSGLVVALCFLIMALFATVGMEFPVDMDQLLALLEEILELDLYPDGYGLATVLSGIVSTLSGVVLPMTCLTVGASIAKKHKILASFGIYYGISMVMSWIQGMMNLTAIFDTALMNPDAYMEQMMNQLIVTTVIQAVLAVAGYFVSTWLMKKKLNLN